MMDVAKTAKAVKAVAIFRTDLIEGEVIVSEYANAVKLIAHFTKLPKGKHGFHIHKAGDLRGEGCMGLCEHFDKGNNSHGAGPDSEGERHTGDLGNIEIQEGEKEFKKTYHIKNMSVTDLWGRSIIIHADADDLGKGGFEDSKTTGHSGARIGCAIFGRSYCPPKNARNQMRNQMNKNKTRKIHHILHN